MSRDYELYGLDGIDSQPLKIVQSGRCIGTSARVDHQPSAATDVYDHAFAVPWSEQGELKLIISWRLCANRHSLRARIVSRAHSLPSPKSRSVSLGKSRNTI